MLKGMICLFFGLIAAIPDGWSLCDGTNSTPNLRNRFVVGAGDTYNPGDTGGVDSHTHTFAGYSHWHFMPVGTNIVAGANWTKNTSFGTAQGTTDAESKLSPYYALSYIMKDG